MNAIQYINGDKAEFYHLERFTGHCEPFDPTPQAFLC